MLLIQPVGAVNIQPTIASSAEGQDSQLASASSSSVTTANNGPSKEVDLLGSPAAPYESTMPSVGPPKVVQTQDFNFRITTHEIATSTSYLFVTPAGNYSFSKVLPWAMSYTSLWGNTTSFSGYGIQESGTFLVPGTSGVTLTQTSIKVNSTELTDRAQAHGFLACTYDFSKTPEKTSCEYSQMKGVQAKFNIAWITSADYLSLDSRNSAHASNQIGLTELGNATSVMIGNSSPISSWHRSLALSWKDFGKTQVLYGRLMFASVLYSAVVVQFPQGVENVDPSIVQKTTSSTNYCSLSSWAVGDTIVVSEVNFGSVTTPTATGVIFSTVASISTYDSYWSGNMDAYIWAGTAAASSSQITVNWPEASECYELSGISSTSDHSSTGSGSTRSSTVSTSVGSFTPASGDMVFSFAMADVCDGSTWSSASTGFTNYQLYNGGNGENPVGDGADGQTCAFMYGQWFDEEFPGWDSQYSSSWAGGSTTAGLSTSQDAVQSYYPAGVWVEVAASFPPTVTQPITATLDTTYGGSAQTVTITTCSPFPSTFSGDNTQHNIAMLGSCVYIMTLPSGYQWEGASSGTSCSSGTCSSFGYTYERTPVTQPISATLSGSGSTQTITISGCGRSPASFAGDGSSHSITAAPSCGLTISTPAGYDWQNDGSSETVNTCPSGTCSTSSWNYVVTVAQPLNATLTGTGGGSAQMISVSGCGTTLSSFNGNSSQPSSTVDASCSLSLTLPSGYIWLNSSSSSVMTFRTCPTGPCSALHVSYVLGYYYVGAYMKSSSHWEVNAVMATVSFKGTIQSQIQSTNSLSAGIFENGATGTNGLDYAYSATLNFPGSGSMNIEATVTKVCEGFNPCGLVPYEIVQYDHVPTTPTLSPADNVTLEMKGNSTGITWYYSVNGGTNSSFGSWKPASGSGIHTKFEVGTFNVNLLNGLWQVKAKYFQFGVLSRLNTGNTGWKVNILNPQYLNSSGGSWHIVLHSTLAQGSNAWLDDFWRWGGFDYGNTTACYADSSICSLPSYDVSIKTSSSTISDGVDLW